MEKETKYTIIGLVATLFCLAVAITCAVLRKFDVVSIVMLSLVAAFTIFACVLMLIDFIKERKAKKA